MRPAVRLILFAFIAAVTVISAVRAADRDSGTVRAAADHATSEVFSIFDAINQAAQTHPGVGEAAANRRATEAELEQNKSTLLPQVRLEARAGPERFTHNITPPPLGNGEWKDGRQASVVVRQLLFDGFASINNIWRQAARVDAAAARVLERTELIALDAAEAYIDVIRYMRILAVARTNLEKHREILENVKARFAGGRIGEGDNQLAIERVAAAEAIYAEFRQTLDDARAKYRKTVGLEPYNLRFPTRLAGLPKTKDESLATAIQYNPTIRAAQSDKDAAKYAFDATAGTFVPTVTLEGRASTGRDANTFIGDRHEESAKIVLSWDIFRGGQDSWARHEAAERYAEQGARHARLQRIALESLDKAWAARTITSDRAVALVRQVESSRKVVEAYTKEYEVGQRTLIDRLNAENQFLNAQVSLISVRSVAVFADYQLLAVMGQLLDYLKAPQPVEAEPIDTRPFNLLFPTKLPPVLIRLPHQPGSEPLNANSSNSPAFVGPYVVTLSERAPYWKKTADAIAELRQSASTNRMDPTQLFTHGFEDDFGRSSALAYGSNDQNQVPWPFLITPTTEGK